jgi:hypothetical protein
MQGQKIINARAVPGTLGCIAWTLDGNLPVILSNWHVLYGNGAIKNDTIWLVKENKGQYCLQETGRVLHGKIGTVQFGEKQVYVDCAIGSYHTQHTGANGLFAAAQAEAITGESVYKYGAATGLTWGIVMQTRHSEKAVIGNCSYMAGEQLLIAPVNNTAFSAKGDSGAVIFNTRHQVVGLLWGTNSSGYGLACPILPVAAVLNIDFKSPQ